MIPDYHCDDIPPTAPTGKRCGMNEAQLRDTADVLELARERIRSMAGEIATVRNELRHANQSRKAMQTTIDILSEQVVEREQEIAALRAVTWLSTVKPVDMRAV